MIIPDTWRLPQVANMEGLLSEEELAFVIDALDLLSDAVSQACTCQGQPDCYDAANASIDAWLEKLAASPPHWGQWLESRRNDLLSHLDNCQAHPW